ncbi:hydroxyisourate hydrolase [Bauldia sp.]|uniref:hydroxyisourate hydrolase n=1 Tax=Bauldia sp. TaxID=2575872 RepID=UPI003BAD387E
MGRITTHVLDTATGRPAAGLRIDLVRPDAPSTAAVSVETNADGRVDGPLVEGADMTSGAYELRFHVGAYFRNTGREGGFYETVPVRFVIETPEDHFHVPLLISPFGYTTYRGS